jgi:hypothetical protein
MNVNAQIVSVEVNVSGSSLSLYVFRARVKFSDGGDELGEVVFEERTSTAPQAGQTKAIVHGFAKQILQRRNELQASQNAMRTLVPEITKGIEELL